ncbi:DUF2164 family protein [Vibrio sonorensis]|uniref:DUF2164 family protein n=1 Tax=Vibrio sonorensis TaxID=1004316 RepID=UPI0008D8D986|nr:DUF2164 family protein [Vibrio sonorensis]
MTDKLKLDTKIYDLVCTDVAEYLFENHGLELGQFEQQFLVDFIVDKLGKEFFNKGIEQAIYRFSKLSESIKEELDMEKIYE